MAISFDFAMHTLDIAFGIASRGLRLPICLGCANCSRLVTSAYLRRLDGIKLIYNIIKNIYGFFLAGVMQNDIPNTYTKKRRKTRFEKALITLASQLEDLISDRG